MTTYAVTTCRSNWEDVVEVQIYHLQTHIENMPIAPYTWYYYSVVKSFHKSEHGLRCRTATEKWAKAYAEEKNIWYFSGLRSGAPISATMNMLFDRGYA